MTAKEKVQALLDAANEATGKSDADLTSAVSSLIAGQGITPSGSLPISANGTYDVAQYASAEVNVPAGETVYWSIPNTVVPDDTYAIQYTKHIVFPQGMIKGRNYIFCDELESIYGTDLTIVDRHFVWSCKKLKSIILPKVQKFDSQYFIRQQEITSAIETITLGSIGYPFYSLSNNWNYGNNWSGCTITFYVDATTIEEAHTAITNWSQYGGQNTSNCTIVFRNSTTGEVIEA